MKRASHVEAGRFVMVGERFGTPLYLVLNDLPKNSPLSRLCYQACLEIGAQGPQTFRFISMFWVPDGGGVQIVCDRSTLDRYLRVNYDSIRKGTFGDEYRSEVQSAGADQDRVEAV